MNNHRESLCAWCQTEQHIAVPEGASHTICPRHYEAMMDAMRDMSAEEFLITKLPVIWREQDEQQEEEQRCEHYTGWQSAGVVVGTMAGVALGLALAWILWVW